METLGIRDIIGPIMIGPSSSHTAGALRIALMARQVLGGEPVRAICKLYGSFARTYHGHGTDRALAAGLLGLAPDDERIRTSLDLAAERGVEISFSPVTDEQPDHPNTVDILMEDASGREVEVRGVSVGGGAAELRSINGVEVHLTGEHHSIVTEQRDVPGVLAHITACLNAANVNIATARLFRTKRGEAAYTVIETDEELPEGLSAAILLNHDITSVSVIRSERVDNENLHRAETVEPMWKGRPLPPFSEVDFATGAEMLAYCEANDLPLSDAICIRERALLAAEGFATDATSEYLDRVIEVMRAAATTPLENPRRSMGGLIGGEAKRLRDLRESGRGLPDSTAVRASEYAMATLETNASMGLIVAAATAGSSGVIPGVLFALQDARGFTDAQLHRALANAAAIGYLVARNATVSGAEGGCQAEVGSASAMAASAACELLGGTPAQCFDAAANAIAGLLGLVCDPIAGLVESPCQKRNATGAVNALACAQIALAGCSNVFSFDEAVDALYAVGLSLPFELRESALGGMAATPSACRYCMACE